MTAKIGPSLRPTQHILEPNANVKCRAKEFGNPGPFHIKPKAHAKKEEMFEDERRRSKLPRDIVEDNLVLGQPKS